MPIIKRVSAILCVIVIAFTTMPVAFAEDVSRLQDYAEYFDEFTTEEVVKMLDEASEQTNLDVVVYANKSNTSSDSIKSVTENFYKSKDYGENGIILNIDTEAENVCIVPIGSADETISNDKLEELTSELLDDMKNGSHYLVVWEFVTEVKNNFSDSSLSTERIIDDAGLYTDEEIEKIDKMLADAVSQTNWDFRIYTNYNGINANNMEYYTDDLYDAKGYGIGENKDGVFLVVDMSSREMYFLVRGETMYYFSDSRVKETKNDIISNLTAGDYMEAADVFVNYSVKYYNEGKPKFATYWNFDGQVDGFTMFLSYLMTAEVFIVIIGIIIALVVTFIINNRYKNNGKETSYDLIANSAVQITDANDKFVTKNVHSYSNSSSSSHSGGNSGGSHSSHGGGGGHF